ncbi:MAG: hypothetical protein PHP69_07005 [Candidatus Omnitrophica bacterium]|jgi:methyl-accepting chemotaxis protein|nr:hypothetical protein [Candidatus Omnitrophota bacterium]MDD5080718.1 hypothetical protein [Candidatus Omnitrophota bacterium]MDD5440682.1 hypothetical protein [Candidatus Omnitrophota bacterium]
MDGKKKRRLLSLSVPVRFKFIQVTLLLIVFSFFINAYFVLNLVKTNKIVVMADPSYIAFQLNFVAAILILVIAITFLLHYGFGALSRMERIIQKFLNGEFNQRIVLRKNDIMKPFADDVNKVLDYIEKNPPTDKKI